MEDRVFGEIVDYPIGSFFKNRVELSKAKVHRPNIAGISGSYKEGSDSIVLSGGYADEDYGDLIIYTGEGGRDANTGRQISDQELTGKNLALVKSMELGLPVRVTRGYEHKSPYSPLTGYRYDGLYFVEDYWKGSLDGYLVWKYKLTKLEGSVPLVDGEIDETEVKIPNRRETVTMRIIRDTKKSQEVKRMYDYHCQICGTRLEGPNNPYAEAAHIKPLGRPHNGPDSKSNIICLCPNHHILFDMRAFSINPDLTLDGISGRLILRPNHKLDQECLKYRKKYY